MTLSIISDFAANNSLELTGKVAGFLVKGRTSLKSIRPAALPETLAASLIPKEDKTINGVKSAVDP